MTTEEILALSPGPEMDRAVHQHVFGGEGKVEPYSTKESAGLKILDRLRLFVGVAPINDPKYDATRPFVAGVLRWEPSIQGDAASLRVTAPSKLSALCKAALISVRSPQLMPRADDGAGAKPMPPPLPRLGQPRRPSERSKLPELPKRPTSFKGPTPLPVAGNAKTS